MKDFNFFKNFFFYSQDNTRQNFDFNIFSNFYSMFHYKSSRLVWFQRNDSMKTNCISKFSKIHSYWILQAISHNIIAFWMYWVQFAHKHICKRSAMKFLKSTYKHKPSHIHKTDEMPSTYTFYVIQYTELKIKYNFQYNVHCHHQTYK